MLPSTVEDILFSIMVDEKHYQKLWDTGISLIFVYASVKSIVSYIWLYFKSSDNRFLAMRCGNQGYHKGEKFLSIITVWFVVSEIVQL